MVSEKQLEDIICKYPELLEQGLTLKGRQIHVYGKIMDVLFEDKFGQKLIVELKKGVVLRNHIGQIMEYEGSILSEEDPAARVMLVGNRVPPNLAKALDHHGIEYKEIPISDLLGFLKEKNDSEYIQLLSEDNVEAVDITDNSKKKTQSKECSIEAFLKIVEDPSVLENINYLRSRIKSLGSDIKEYARRWHWIMFKSSKGQFCGIGVHKNHIVIFINLPRNQFKSDTLDIKGNNYVKINIQPQTDLNLITEYINKAYQVNIVATEIDFEKAALYAPTERVHIDKALELLKERDKLYFYTNANIGSLFDLSIESIYFKLKGEKAISLQADFIELVTGNPDETRLPKARYYYGYKNLRFLNQPIEQTDLRYFKTGNPLSNSTPGACIILDPKTYANRV
jgi:predicted transport protein